MPSSAISRFTYAFQSSSVSLRVIAFMAALASSVVASTATVLPRSNFFCWAMAKTWMKTRSCTSTGRRWRMRVRLEWSGVASVSGTPRKARSDKLSAHRQAMARWESRPSK
jgi:hypothetical protein